MKSHIKCIGFCIKLIPISNIDEILQLSNKLELTTLSQHHPQLIPSILKSLLTITLQYFNEIDEFSSKSPSKPMNNEENYFYDPNFDDIERNIENSQVLDYKQIAMKVVDRFDEDWSSTLQALSILDDLYGITGISMSCIDSL